MNALRRLDKGLARGLAALTAAVLLVMVVVAATQAGLRNLTNFDIAWANLVLEHMEWADSFLQKGTLWLAFLGAALATHEEKHIAIDVLFRIAKPQAKALMRAIVSLFAGVVCFYLARVFWLSVLNNAKEIPLDYSVLGANDEMVHICDAALSTIAEVGLSRPDAFCIVRSGLDLFGAEMSTPDVALQLIVPAMFMFMAIRLLLRAVQASYMFVTKRAGEEKYS